MSASKFTITCVFEDAATRVFPSTPMETVYQAALRSGLTLQTDCREGACATCKAYCSGGQADIGDVSDEALSDEEAREGYVLICQARARSDLVLEFPYPLTSLSKARQTWQAQVAEVAPVAESVIRLVLTGAVPDFLPGQYVHITVPGQVPRRSYSFAQPPGSAGTGEEAGQMVFYVRLLPSGAMSDYLRTHARVGDRVELEGPYGQFFLRPSAARRLLMVAGGTGLAPMLSMLGRLPDPAPQVTVLYGANRPGELFGLDELKARGASVHTIVAGSEPGDDWTGPTGFVTDLIGADTLPEPAGTDVYLCGPPAMIDAARAAVQALGVPARRVFAEKFLPS
jgi:NAD(P)H-flavin reductase/ferredoxin